MIKNNGKVEAYQVSFIHILKEVTVTECAFRVWQWSSAGTTWQQIGEVTDAVGSGRKQVYQGIEYDYVFDVDIAEGQPPLKLPYNVRGKSFQRSSPW